MMSRVLQKVLLVVGVIALVALVVEISLSVAATMHGSTPKRVVHVMAGPYALQVSLYDDPANAGFALPFAIAPQPPMHGSLTYDVTSLPDEGIHATPVHASIGPDANVAGGVQGDAEIPVQGQWFLHIIVNGSAGEGVADVPITATAPPAIPGWLGWVIGYIPLVGLVVFVGMQYRRRKRVSVQGQEVGAQEGIKEGVK